MASMRRYFRCKSILGQSPWSHAFPGFTHGSHAKQWDISRKLTRPLQLLLHGICQKAIYYSKHNNQGWRQVHRKGGPNSIVDGFSEETILSSGV